MEGSDNGDRRRGRDASHYCLVLLFVIGILKAEGAKDGIQFFIMGRAFSTHRAIKHAISSISILNTFFIVLVTITFFFTHFH
jgi:hypothetical protein